MLLKQLYNRNSLKNTDTGVRFALKNRLKDAKVTGIHMIKIDGKDIPIDQVTLILNEQRISPADISKSSPVDFPLRQIIFIEQKNTKIKSFLLRQP